MSAEKIIERIKQDSEKEIENILTNAKKQANSIIEDAKNKANLESKKIISEGKKQEENMRRIMISKAKQDIKRDIMNAREKIIEDCFTKAHHQLSIMDDSEYIKIVKNLIENGCKKIQGKCNILVSRKLDRDIAEKMNLNITGKVETAGGIIIKSSDNKISLDYTFDGILKHKKDEIRRKVGKLLFSE